MSDHVHTPCRIVHKTMFGLRHTTECVVCHQPMGNVGETAEVRLSTRRLDWRIVAIAFGLVALAIWLW